MDPIMTMASIVVVDGCHVTKNIGFCLCCLQQQRHGYLQNREWSRNLYRE